MNIAATSALANFNAAASFAGEPVTYKRASLSISVIAIPGKTQLWSDDGADPDYNQLVRAPHAFGHERLHRADPLYDLVLVTDWNWPHAVPGRGSAIFLHRWRRPGAATAGCVALAAPDLLWIARRLLPDSPLIIRG